MPFINKIGNRYGYLLVVSRASNTRKRQARFICLCDCGKLKTIRSYNLRDGGTHSCGCRHGGAHKQAEALAKEQSRLHREQKQLLREAEHTARKKQKQSRHRSRFTLDEKRTLTYESWHQLLQRTRNSRHHKFYLYGAKGVTVCDRWNPAAGGSFENFLADMGERPAGTTIGRFIDLGNYEPGNCKWMTPAEQGIEKRKKNALAA